MRTTQDTLNELADMRAYAKELEAKNDKLERALEICRDYLDLSLGSPSYEGPSPYEAIDAALGKRELSQ